MNSTFNHKIFYMEVYTREKDLVNFFLEILRQYFTLNSVKYNQ